jgi:collagenase-like PrtC family protease
MAMNKDRAMTSDAELTLGPVLFNWQPEVWRDFYFRIADEAPVSTVYVGEVVCSKRAVFFEPLYEAVAERLRSGGKNVVFSTLSEVMLPLDRKQVEAAADLPDALVEANDGAGLWHLAGRPHHVGPFVNAYNELTLAVLARRGAINVCLPGELPLSSMAAMGEAARALGVSLETQVFGRQPLALSARCYHARAHGRTKDSCLFVCEEDPDGLALETLSGQPFLTINGIQTLSSDYLVLLRELPQLVEAGVHRLRLSPQACDMVAVATAYRAVLDHAITPGEALDRLSELGIAVPFANGFAHRKAGHVWVEA